MKGIHLNEACAVAVAAMCMFGFSRETTAMTAAFQLTNGPGNETSCFRGTYESQVPSHSLGGGTSAKVAQRFAILRTISRC